MGEIGHSAKSTPKQREDVLRLGSEGVSIRQIAVRVYGSKAYRGRVERILKLSRSAGVAAAAGASVEPEDVDFDTLGDVALMRLLFERTSRHWAKNGIVPSMSAIAKQLEVLVRLMNLESYERLQAALRSEGVDEG
jgi:DNA-binding CsgD family transcriptional regulator